MGKVDQILKNLKKEVQTTRKSNLKNGNDI